MTDKVINTSWREIEKGEDVKGVVVYGSFVCTVDEDAKEGDTRLVQFPPFVVVAGSGKEAGDFVSIKEDINNKSE